MLQIVLTLILYLLPLIPVGNYVYRIAAGKHTFADPVMDRVDHAIYKLCGVNPERSMDWKRYAGTLVGTNLVMILLGYLILRLQSLLFLNRKHGPIALIQHNHQLYDQYKPAALRR